MTDPDIPEIIEPSRTDKIKLFFLENKTPIACTVTGIVAFAAGRTIVGEKMGQHVNDLRTQLDGALHEVDNLSLDMRVMQDFIEAKKLTPKFLAFADEANIPNPS